MPPDGQDASSGSPPTKAKPAGKAGVKRRSTAGEPGAPPLTALLVDDDTVSRLIVARQLERRCECKILHAASGERALQMLQESKPDLIVLDLNMPGTDGIATLRVIKQTAATKDVPVMIVSGSAIADDVRATIDLGAVDYLLKPLSPSNAGRRISRLIALARRRLGAE